MAKIQKTNTTRWSQKWPSRDRVGFCASFGLGLLDSKESGMAGISRAEDRHRHSRSMVGAWSRPHKGVAVVSWLDGTRDTDKVVVSSRPPFFVADAMISKNSPKND